MSVDSFETVLRHLFLGFGIEVAASEEESIFINPVEPLQMEPPHLWIRAAALHLDSLRFKCMDTVSNFETVAAIDSSQEEISEALWNTFEQTPMWDFRFHAFYFSIYGELIRYLLINADDIYTSFPIDSLRPQADEVHGVSTIDFDQISQRLSQFSSLSTKDLMVVCNDIRQLYTAAKMASAALELFESSSQENASVRSLRFANVQSTVLTLAHALLRADVSGMCLLSSLKE